jgi:hypothetical protein
MGSSPFEECLLYISNILQEVEDEWAANLLNNFEDIAE